MKLPTDCMNCHKPLAYTSLLCVEEPVWIYTHGIRTHTTTCIHCGETNCMTEAKNHAVQWRPGTGKTSALGDSVFHWPKDRKWWDPEKDLTATYRQRHVVGRNTELHYEGDGSGWTPLATPPDTLMIPPSLASLNDVYTSLAETEKRLGRMLGIDNTKLRTLAKQEQLRRAYGGLPYFGKMEA